MSKLFISGGVVIDPQARRSFCAQVLLEDGIIAAIGDLTAPQDAQVIDARGLFVCPGFIDCHVHNTLDDYAPQRGAVGCYADALYGGTTSIVSEG